MLVEHVGLVLPRGRCDERDVPTVGVLRGDAQRDLLAAAPDPDRQARLRGLGLALRVVQCEELAFERGPILREEAAHALHVLGEHA